MSTEPKASIVIPTYNRGKVICQAIEEALQQDYANYEVVVIDQTAHYPADIQSRLDSLKSRIRYVHRDQPNVSAARNAGVLAATGEIIVFIDDDVHVGRDYLSSMVRHFADGKTGAVMPLVIPSNEADIPRALQRAAHMFWTISPIVVDSVVSVQWASTCSVACSRSALIEGGLFDEYLSSWCEDADMSVRLSGCGYRLLLDTRIRVTHLVAAEGGCEDRNSALWSEREVTRLHLYSYYMIKERHIMGARKFWKDMFNAYRVHLFNRRAYTEGPIVFIRRFWKTFGILLTAASAVRHRRAAR